MPMSAPIRVAVLHSSAERRGHYLDALRAQGFDTFALDAAPVVAPKVVADVLFVEGALAMSYGWFRSENAAPMPDRPLVILSASGSLRAAVGARGATAIPDPAERAEIANAVLMAVKREVPASAAARPDPLASPARDSVVTALEAVTGASSPKLSGVTSHVARALDVPIALVTMVDSKKQLFLAQTGLPADLARANGTVSSWAFCAESVRDGAPLVVPDARDDPRFANNPLVEAKIVRSYAGVPIVLEGLGHVGTVCALSGSPRAFSEADLAVLDMAATLVASELEAARARTPRVDAAAPTQAGAVPEIGTLLDGKYWITASLGEGGQASVLLARDRLLGHLVAIKLMQEVPNADELLLREARALAKVRHPNLVAVHGWGRTTEDRMYVVLDYVEGESLEQRARATHGAEPVAFVMKTLREIAAALASMHAVGLLHGDVKPSNVMIDRALDRAVLIDLGVGVFYEEEHKRRRGLGGGTPGYSAPEQFTNDRLDPSADVYGLAATAYAMLAGNGPFSAVSASQQIGSQMRGEVRPIGGARPEVSAEADALLLRALSPDPAARPQSVLGLVDALARALKTHP